MQDVQLIGIEQEPQDHIHDKAHLTLEIFTFAVNTYIHFVYHQDLIALVIICKSLDYNEGINHVLTKSCNLHRKKLVL